ncbi:MAG: hypothetical protein EP330_12970 [Deltaproteobacteria bacterium]|nr:MAG: hypothetical protein EP330_12970 [Deltaproteobacteria bacterium]
MRRVLLPASTGLLTLGLGLACFGGGGGADPAVEAAIEDLDGTALVADDVPVLAPISMSESGRPTEDLGNGVQVFQVSPVGTDRRPLQAAVVFDRAMVPLTGLADMNAKVPLTCDPASGLSGRWAGTSTAVIAPKDGAFPLATKFTCSVPAGTAAIDGVALEKPLTWTFETARPRVRSATPYRGARRWDPSQPLSVSFDQPVTLDSVKSRVSVQAQGGAKVPFTVEADPEAENTFLIKAELAKDTGYDLTVDAGVLATAGPLASTERFSTDFRTYPPLAASYDEPTGDSVDPHTSLRLDFTTPVSRDEVSEHLTVTPEPPGWEPPTGEWTSSSFWYWTRWEPRTRYTVTLAAGVEDEYGQKLEQPLSWSFTTGDYQPHLNVPQGLALVGANNPAELPMQHLNLQGTQARVVRLDPSRVNPFEWWKAAEPALNGVASVPVSPGPEANRVARADVAFANALDGGFGWVATDVTADNLRNYQGKLRNHRGLLVVTDLAGTLKLSPGKSDVWVTSLESGKAVSGASVELMKGSSAVAKATTDGDGRAHFDVGPETGWRQWGDDKFWARMTLGKDVSLVTQNMNDGIGPWAFDIYTDFEPRGFAIAAHGYADRGVYRPGDKVYARATFRKQSAEGLELPSGEVTWTLSDPEGSEVATGEGKLDARGGVNVETAIPEEGMLGGWDLRVNAKGDDWNRSVYIQVPAHAYREPAYRVSVSADADAIAGDKATATAQARYLFGAPLPRAKVSWQSWSENESFAPDGWDGWSFGPPPPSWWEDEHDSGPTISQSERGEVLDGKSTFTVDIPSVDRPVRLFLEAGVEDVDRQYIANNTSLMVHPAAVYGGVRPGERMPTAGESTWVEVAAVSPEGKATAGIDLAVKVVRTTWDSVREKGMDGRWRWVTNKTETEVHQESVSSGATAKRVSFTPTEPGRHTVFVTATDGKGRTATAEETLWVTGAGYTPWARRDDGLLALIPDKEVYAPGDTAHILVQSPMPGLSALVTVEREGVLHSQVVELEGTAETVDIPITDAFRPNVFVSVVAITGAGPQDAPDKGRPEVFVGMKHLSVETESEHLAVTVTPKKDVYRPRDEVEVTVKVERAGDAVSGAGVTLYAVDEAVLSLTAYKTPDAHGAMYADRALSTLTADARTGVLDRSSYLTKGANRGGGGGMGDGPQLRTDFVTTVTWQPNLKTGADGTVTARFKLKDNLTTFRVMAVVDDQATGFGSGEREITVTRPILARPALPRVLRPGDTSFAGVVVHNNTDDVAEILVEGSVTGPVTLEGSPTTIFLAPGNAKEVPFRLSATGEGTATFDFLVSSGPEKDGVRHEIEVVKDLVREVVASSGSLEGSAAEAIALPKGVVPDEGGLQVDLATTALVGAGAGLDYLVEYPHGCVEQRTSRALGSLMALRVRESAGVDVPEANLRANVEGVLAELAEFEHPSGGLSYWKGGGGQYASVMGTAYAVEFMGRAREAGFTVNEDLLDKNARFLREAARGKYTPSWWNPLASKSARASVALALARIGKADSGLHNELFNAKRELSTVSVAQLANAIAISTGPDRRTKALVSELESRMFIEASAATVREEEGGKYRVLWGSDDLASAATLEALLAIDDKPALGPKLALGLAQSRKHAYWANTRGTAGVLAALAGYADRFEAGGGEVAATVALAGKELYGEKLKLPESAAVTVPLAELKDGKLAFESDGGRLYYQSRLSYVLEDAPPTDHGFTMIRKLELVDGGTPEGRVVAGASLRVTLQVITPVTRYDVAVIDRIPAGLEPVNGSFATASKAPEQPPEPGEGSAEVPAWGGDWVFDHSEIDDDQVRLYADWMPPGIHTFRYQVRATSPGDYAHPPATVEEMYEPENFGRTGGGRLVVGRTAEIAAQ